MEEVFEIIRGLLLQIPELKWVDWQMGQLEQANPGVNFPCALVDISLPGCKDTGGKEQLCKARVDVVLAFTSDGEKTASIYPDAMRTASQEYFKTVRAVYKKLQGYSDEQIDELSRKQLLQDLKKGGIKITLMSFETEFVDLSAED